jgi:hypothetical protein
MVPRVEGQKKPAPNLRGLPQYCDWGLGINAWITSAGIEDGRLLRSVSKSGKINGDSLNDWVVWSVVEQSSCAGRTVGIWSRSSSCSATPQFRPPSAIWGRSESCADAILKQDWEITSSKDHSLYPDHLTDDMEQDHVTADDGQACVFTYLWPS